MYFIFADKQVEVEMKPDYQGLDEATPNFEIRYHVRFVGARLQDGPQ